LKEYQIATEVLGRPADFDPHSDSSVRVQMGRLRTKLAEYYSGEGAADPILIDIPKGRYTLSFRTRPLADQPSSPIQLVPLPVSVLDPETDPPTRPAYRLTRTSWAILSAAAVFVALVGIAWLFGHSLITSSVLAKHKTPQPPTALETLWGPFLHGPSEPFVVFKNSSFIGDPASGMRRFDPVHDNPNQLVQHYTGVGEVMGVLELDQLFGKFGAHFRVKRGSLFNVDDARDNNLVFVGSPSRNADLNDIPSTREFTFRRLNDGARHVRVAIVDSHPRSRATEIYSSPSGVHSERVEYAIVGMVRGLDPAHWTFFLEGTSTVATEAAVDFVCNEATASDLLNRLQMMRGAPMKPFEGLLKVQVANDVPLETQLLDLRTASTQ
jgi:hypothetical protein